MKTERGSACAAACIDRRVVGVHRQPRLPGREAGVCRVVPLHRRAGVVAALDRKRPQHGLGVDAEHQCGGVVVDRLDVAVVADLVEAGVRHAELLALVDVGRAAVQVQHGREGLGGVHPVLLAVVAEARHRPWLVVVVPVERVPADVGEAHLPRLEVALEHRQRQVGEVPLRATRRDVEVDVLEGEDHVELVAAGVGDAPRELDRRAGHLARP